MSSFEALFWQKTGGKNKNFGAKIQSVNKQLTKVNNQLTKNFWIISELFFVLFLDYFWIIFEIPDTYQSNKTIGPQFSMSVGLLNQQKESESSLKEPNLLNTGSLSLTP